MNPGKRLEDLFSILRGAPGLGNQLMVQAELCGGPAGRGILLKLLFEFWEFFYKAHQEIIALSNHVSTPPKLDNEMNRTLYAISGENAAKHFWEEHSKQLAAGVPLDDLLPQAVEELKEFWA